MKNQYLTRDLIKSHAIQFQAFKDTDSKEIGGLPKLTDSTDVLSWLESMEKQLQKLPGVDFPPLLISFGKTKLRKQRLLIYYLTNVILNHILPCWEN